MKVKSARAKGKLLEDYVADQIVAKGIDPKARRDGASGAGTREKGDVITSMMVIGQNAGFECKNQKNVNIQEWWRQTKKLESLGREPILVYKIENERWEDTKCVIYLDTFLELVKQSKGTPTEISVEKELTSNQKYALSNLKESIKRVQREFE